MALEPSDFEASPSYAAIKIFAVAVGISLVILGFVYVVYAGSRRGTGLNINIINNPRVRARRTRDLEAATEPAIEPATELATEPATNPASRNSCSAHTVDTLPLYEARDAAQPEQVHGGELERNEEEEEAEPPPYTFDAGGPVVTDVQHGEVLAGVTTPPAPVHLPSS